MRRRALRSDREEQRRITAALQWLWIALGFALLAALIAFTRLRWGPVLILAVLIPFAAATLVSDLRSGKSEPILKLPLGPYWRAEEPGAYWTSVSWNAVLLAGVVACAVAAFFGAVTI